MAPQTPQSVPSGFVFARAATSPKRRLACAHSAGMKPSPSSVEPSRPMTEKAGLMMLSIGFLPQEFSRAKAMRPALVCRTLVTVTSAVWPMQALPPSTTSMVPSSR